MFALVFISQCACLGYNLFSSKKGICMSVLMSVRMCVCLCCWVTFWAPIFRSTSNIILMLKCSIIINFLQLFEECMCFRYFGVFNAEILQLLTIIECKIFNKSILFVDVFVVDISVSSYLDEVIFGIDMLGLDELPNEHTD